MYHRDIIYFLNLLRSRGKRITARAIDEDMDFYELAINGKLYGVWTSIGLMSILAQYIKPTYPNQWFVARSIPFRI